MEIPPEVQTWITKEFPTLDFSHPLSDSTIFSLQSAQIFPPLLKQVFSLLNIKHELQNLSEPNSSAAILYNWNIVIKALSLLKIDIDSDTKALLVAGDTQLILQVIRDLYNAQHQPPVDENKRKFRKVKMGPDGSIFIESIDSNKPLRYSETCLEYLLISFCQNFQLLPKQAAGLLTQNGKYLTQIITKGLRGKFDPIIGWYKQLQGNIDRLLQLLEQEMQNESVELLMSSLCPGLYAKSLEVVLETVEILYIIGNRVKGRLIWEKIQAWFKEDGGGTSGCMAAYQKFGEQIFAKIGSLILLYFQNGLEEFFDEYLQKFYPVLTDSSEDSYLNIILHFLTHLSQEPAIQSLPPSVLESWIDLASTHSVNEKNNDIRVTAINFLIKIWELFPQIFDHNEVITNNVINILKRTCRDKNVIVKHISLAHMFYLLQNFTQERNPNAPTVYKALTFSLVENYMESLTREFIVSNFTILLEAIPGLPISILAEPLIKQLQISNKHEYNVFDFELFVAIGMHKRLTLKYGIQLVDLLGKVYFNDLRYSNAAVVPMMLIITRFIAEDPLKEIVSLFVKYGLDLVIKHEIEYNQKPSRGKRSRPDSTVGTPSITASQLDREAKWLQKRNISFNLINKIIRLSSEPLNTKITEMLLKAHLDIKFALGQSYKPIVMTLSALTDAERAIEEYEMENMQLVTPQESSNSVALAESEGDKSVSMAIALYKPPKGRVMQDIARLKQKRIDKQREEEMQKLQQQKVEERRKRALRVQLERRKIELGKEGGGFILEEGKAQIKENIELIEVGGDDMAKIQLILRRYVRILKLLFKKYADSGYKVNNQDKTFDLIQNNNMTISEGEFYSLLKEQGINNHLMTLEQFKQLIKAYAVRYRMTSTALIYKDYLNMIIQCALFIFSKPPRDLSNMPLALSVYELFALFRHTTAHKGNSTIFFDEPDPGVGERDVIRQLNQRLLENPDLNLPDGYKKVIDKELVVEYKVPQRLAIPESSGIAIEILDQILNDTFKVHILEPILEVKEVARARGILLKPRGSSNYGTRRSFSSDTRTIQLGLPIGLNASLSPEIKVAISSISSQYRSDDLIECAKVLEDLLYSVELGSYTLIHKVPNKPGNIKNRVVERQELMEKEFKFKQDEQERRRRLRRQLIHQKLKDSQVDIDKKRQEELEAQKRQEERMKSIMLRRQEKQRQDKEQLQKDLQDWKEKKQAELLAKQEEEAKAKALLETKKKQGMEAAKQKEHKRIAEMLKAKQQN